jgi:hypothetical protein
MTPSRASAAPDTDRRDRDRVLEGSRVTSRRAAERSRKISRPQISAPQIFRPLSKAEGIRCAANKKISSDVFIAAITSTIPRNGMVEAFLGRYKGAETLWVQTSSLQPSSFHGSGFPYRMLVVKALPSKQLVLVMGALAISKLGVRERRGPKGAAKQPRAP